MMETQLYTEFKEYMETAVDLNEAAFSVENEKSYIMDVTPLAIKFRAGSYIDRDRNS